jgi:hypothetical protein
LLLDSMFAGGVKLIISIVRRRLYGIQKACNG